MTIFLYSKSNFIADELKKEPEFIKSLIIKSSLPDLQINLEKEIDESIIIHHISDFPDDAPNISLLIKNNPKLVANNPIKVSISEPILSDKCPLIGAITDSTRGYIIRIIPACAGENPFTS